MENTPSFAVTDGPLVSIIMPVYNVAPYLSRCLDSLAAQTYSNIEVVIMDDCSTDGTFQLAVDMEKRDSRFRAYQMPHNSGAGDTRQAAIERSTGEIIGFVDGDDWVDEEFVSVLYGLMKKTQSDIACCQHYFYDDGSYSMFTPWVYNSDIVELSAKEAMNKMRHYNQIDESLWNKLYRRELILSYRMTTSPFEDGLIIYKYFSKARRVALCCIPLYYYYQREGSLMHTLYSPRKAFVRFQMEMVKDCAISGCETLTGRQARKQMKRGLKLLREYALLEPSEELQRCCKDVVESIRKLDDGKCRFGMRSLFLYPILYKRPEMYLRLQQFIAKTFRRRKVKKVRLKYSMQTMEVFQRGW